MQSSQSATVFSATIIRYLWVFIQFKGNKCPQYTKSDHLTKRKTKTLPVHFILGRFFGNCLKPEFQRLNKKIFWCESNVEPKNLFFRALNVSLWHRAHNKNTELKKRAGNSKLSRKLRRKPVLANLMITITMQWIT